MQILGPLSCRGRLPVRPSGSQFVANLRHRYDGILLLRIDDAHNPEFWLEATFDAKDVNSLVPTIESDDLEEIQP